MFKFLLKLIFTFILLFGVSNYANYLVTGKTLDLDLKKSLLSDISISKLSNSISGKAESVNQNIKPEAEESYLYKWRDEKGVIHYTSEKPSVEINNLESMKINNQSNVIPALSYSKNSSNTEQAQQISRQLSTELPENIYSPEGIKQLFDQARGIQNLMDDQFNQQENLINNY
jgi:hypothetical protein